MEALQETALKVIDALGRLARMHHDRGQRTTMASSLYGSVASRLPQACPGIYIEFVVNTPAGLGRAIKENTAPDFDDGTPALYSKHQTPKGETRHDQDHFYIAASVRPSLADGLINSNRNSIPGILALLTASYCSEKI